MKFEIIENPNVEIAGYDKDDLLVIEGIAFHSGTNANGAVIYKEDAKKDIKTMIGKPLRVLWNGSPSTHGYNKVTNTFDSHVQNIGYIYNAQIIEEANDEYEAEVQAIMWKRYFPEIAEKIVELHKEGNLNFSIEAEREVDDLPNGDRRCVNNNFLGLSMVANPAWKGSKSLLVAEDESTQGDTAPTSPNKSDSKENDTNSTTEQKEALLDTKMSLIRANETNANLTKQINELQKVVESYQIKEKGQSRFDKLSKYTEVKDSIEDLGKLSDEDFLVRFEQELDAYAEKVQTKEPDENVDVISSLIDTRKKNISTDNKTNLLNAIYGN